MKENGNSTEQMEKESFGMQMETSMKGFGKMTRLMARVYIHRQTDRATSVNGKTTCSMVQVKKLGQISLTSWDSISKALSMAKEITSMLMDQFTTVTGQIIKLME